MLLSSTMHHYWLALPYSESWVFETGRRLPLEAGDGRYRVSIEIERRRKETPAGFLRAWLERQDAGQPAASRDATLLEAHGRTVLRYVEPGDDGGRRNYCTVTRRGNDWYLLRLSTVEEEEIPAAVEEQILDLLGAGFDADFE